MKHRLRKPSLFIYNLPEEITTQNVATNIKAQNPEIQSNGEDLKQSTSLKTGKEGTK